MILEALLTDLLPISLEQQENSDSVKIYCLILRQSPNTSLQVGDYILSIDSCSANKQSAFEQIRLVIG